MKRNAAPKGKYYFEYAQDTAEMRKERMKIPRKLTSNLKKEIVKLNPKMSIRTSNVKLGIINIYLSCF
ncbi:MAG: hypothetical protein FWD66_06190 [Paludibacter sp.]|nr:hypothetical protein [Paludibacter sp.]